MVHLIPWALHWATIERAFGAKQSAEWRIDELSSAIEDCAAAHEIKMGKLGQPIRVAITGGSVSPPIDVTLELVGRERTLARLDEAIDLIRTRAANA